MVKKLESNGRWKSSKMMLPQHKEALISRQNPEQEVVQVQKPSAEEHEMILNSRIHSEMVKNKNELKSQKIKVFEDMRSDDDLHYKFICRGSEYPFAIMRDVVKARMSVMLGDDVNSLLTTMKDYRICLNWLNLCFFYRIVMLLR